MNKIELKKQNELIALFGQRKFAELIPLCEKFVKTFTGNAIVWNLLALSHKNLGKLDKAISLYLGLLRENPNNAMLLSNLGNIYRSVGRLQDALGCYKKAGLLAVIVAQPQIVCKIIKIALERMNKQKLTRRQHLIALD